MMDDMEQVTYMEVLYVGYLRLIRLKVIMLAFKLFISRTCVGRGGRVMCCVNKAVVIEAKRYFV